MFVFDSLQILLDNCISILKHLLSISCFFLIFIFIFTKSNWKVNLSLLLSVLSRAILVSEWVDSDPREFQGLEQSLCGLTHTESM